MKRLLFIFTTFLVLSSFLFLSVNLVQAVTDSHGESIQEVLGEILEKNNVSTVQELSCDKISEEDLERLGDAVMEQQHPGEAHVQMDAMMGGEGSESLRSIHLSMGESYLGCGERYGTGMMGGGMMGYGNRSSIGGSPMGFNMNNYNPGIFSLHYIFTAVTWFSLVAFLLSGVYFFLKSSQKKRK
jgi:hypothetical protein